VAVFSQIATLLASTFFGGFFGAFAPTAALIPTVVLVFLFIITIGIGLYSKMSLDGYLVAFGVEIATVGTALNTATGSIAFTAVYVIIGGILVGIAFLRLTRH
jgi:hypothetical protein